MAVVGLQARSGALKAAQQLMQLLGPFKREPGVKARNRGERRRGGKEHTGAENGKEKGSGAPGKKS